MAFVTTADVPESKRFDFWRDVICSTFLHLDCVRISDRPFFGEIASTRVHDVSFARIRARETKSIRTRAQVRQALQEVVLISMQLSGTCWLLQDGREAKLDPGDFAFCDSTRPYSALLSGEFEQLVVHMPRDLWVRKIGPTEQLTARAVRGNTPTGGLVTNFLRQVVPAMASAEPTTAQRLAEVSVALVTTAIGETMSQHLVSGSSSRIALLYRAKTFIEENLHDPNLGPEKVAAGLRISLRYLQDLFHGENTTVSDWIWDRRLERCRRELSDPLLATKSVGEIAFDCGFSAFPHFSRKFKAAYSITPSEFRREQLARRNSGASSCLVSSTEFGPPQ
ncbi:MAG: helix-turn-helix domain-containing protein [Terriglobales bacterium]